MLVNEHAHEGDDDQRDWRDLGQVSLGGLGHHFLVQSVRKSVFEDSTPGSE